MNEKSSGSRSRKQRLTAVGTRCADHLTPLYTQKLALSSPTGGGRSVGIVRVRTKATELTLGLKARVLPWEVPLAPTGGRFQSVTDLFTDEYVPMSGVSVYLTVLETVPTRSIKQITLPLRSLRKTSLR